MMGTLNGESARLLAQGQDAARRGDKPAARSLLTQVVERDPHNELAWMWLSGVVEAPEEQQICLENVLVINPQNTKARRGLDFVSTQTGIPPHLPTELGKPSVGASELTAPLSSDSPLYSALAGEQLPSWDSSGGYPMPQGATPSGDDAGSLAFLAFMQNSAGPQPADSREAVDAPYIPQFEDQSAASLQVGSWREGSQPLQQEQLDWGQPDAQFNVLSIADGIDERLAGFDTQGSPLPPWGSAGASGISPGPDLNSAAGSAALAGKDGSYGGSQQALTAASSMGQVNAMGPMGPMGLHSDSNLPSPSELPTFEEPAEQPWYLKPAQQSSPEPGNYGSGGRASSETSDGLRQSPKKQNSAGAMVDCPNCKASVADTSLSCPQCKYSFFVNCPHCHELVDAADAKSGKSEPCPYCQKPINRLELGMAGTDSAISYKSAKASSDSMSKQAMDELEASHRVKQPINFRWLVDVAWLVGIIATVWALSQLPTWLRLAGQY